MNIFYKIRVKNKIRKMCKLMRKRMCKEDVQYSANMILKALHKLPTEKKEGLIDKCLGVLKNVK